LVGIIVIFLILIAVYSYQQTHFEYLGLEFSKIKIGSVPLYYAKVPLYNQNGVMVNYYQLYLRKDPRTLKNISINGKIRTREKIIMAADDIKCEDANLAGAKMGDFWSLAFGVKNVIVGTTNKTRAEENNMEYVDCNENVMYLDSTAVMIKPGNVTEINQKTPTCYEIVVSDCDILRVTERFMLGQYAHAMGLEI
jgi:hypothetical protein